MKRIILRLSSLSFLLFSCQSVLIPQTSGLPKSEVSAKQPQESEPLLSLAGELTGTPTSDHLQFKVIRPLKTQELDRSQIRYVKMWVWGTGIPAKIWNDNAFVDINSAQSVTLEIPGIPKGANRLVTALGYDANKTLIPGAVLQAYYSSPASKGIVTIKLRLGWRFTLLGSALEKLLEKGSPLLNTLNLDQLQGTIDQTLYGGQTPSSTFVVHPSRMSAANIVNLLEKGQGLTPANLAPAGGGTDIMIKQNPQGGVLTNGATVVIADPASSPFTIPAGSDRVLLSGLAIGTWNGTAKINTAAGVQQIPFTVTVDETGSISLSKGTLAAPIIAPPVIANVNNTYAYPTYNGLAGWWQADGNINDSASNNHGSLLNGATYGQGKVGQAFSFDGVNDRFQVADHADLRPTMITAAAWVYPRSVNGDWDIFAARDIGGGRSWNLQADNATVGPCLGKPAFSVFIGAANFFTCGTTALPLNQWSHVAGTLDGTNVKIYVNGALAGQNPAVGNLDTAVGTPLTLGSDGGAGNAFDGLVDGFELYDRALALAEIQGLYSGKSIVITGEGFDTTPANNVVMLGTTPVTVTKATATTLRVLVPANLFGTMPVKVTTNTQVSNQPNVSILPAIDSLSTGLGLVGDNISIAGSNFEVGNTTIKFNGVTATVSGVSSTSLTATVPTGATSGSITVTTSGGTTTGPVFAIAPTGLVSWWRGENNTTDSVGPNHGTLVNGTTYGTGKVGQAFQLDGTNDYVNIPDHNSLDFAAGTDFSVGYWFNADIHKSKQRIISKGSSGCSVGWHTALISGGNSMQFEDGDGGGCDQVNYANGYTLNTWHHHSFTVNKALSQVRFYLNGQFVQNMTITRALSFSTNSLDMVFGYDSQGINEYFDGRIDEIQIYNRKLSDAEVLAIYDATK